MAEAYKCDRCGQFRLDSHYSGAERIDGGTRISWTELDAEGQNTWHGIDLCEMCSPPIMELLKKIEDTTHGTSNGIGYRRII